MIEISKTEVNGFEAAIRGMRNPMNSWDQSDTNCDRIIFHHQNNGDRVGTHDIGEKDHDLMMRLAMAGSTHAKYRRMITVTCDIVAPLYWWKEFDTYKVGTVANSCSTMHKIHAKEFVPGDFSCEKLLADWGKGSNAMITIGDYLYSPRSVLVDIIIPTLNIYRTKFIETKEKVYWEQMIQLLPTSYNQKRTVMMNYEVLVGMYRDRKNHKLDEWVALCRWIKTLPYSELITGEV